MVLHPSVARLLARLGDQAIRVDPIYLKAWLLRRAPDLNAVVADSLGPRLRLVELFAGIGGLGSGLERALGAVTILQAEAEAPRRRLLARRFPLALQLPDVRDTLTLAVPDDPDQLILAGGFPCRGASKANLTGPRGMAHPRTGLWSVMADALRRWRPRALIFENVTVLRSRGLDQVLADIDAAGYDAIWGTLKASDFGAPHERARLFCVAVRRGARPILARPRPPLAAWRPWHGPIPANDPDAPEQSQRVKALGDAVVPIVAYGVGLTAGKVLAGWWPTGGAPHSGRLPPMNGMLRAGCILALPESPFEALSPRTRDRFVTVDEAFASSTPGVCTNRVAAPMVGRVVYAGGDQVDVELPGGDIEPFPEDWVKPLWPTPTSNDGRNRGSRSQWRRRSPGINVLAQADRCPREEWAVGDAIIDMFEGQGVGPGFTEWAMGFPAGWTGGMVVDQGTEGRFSTSSHIRNGVADENIRFFSIDCNLGLQ